MLNREALTKLAHERYPGLIKARTRLQNAALLLNVVAAAVLIFAIVMFAKWVDYDTARDIGAFFLLGIGVLSAAFFRGVAVLLSALGDSTRALADIAVNTDPTLSQSDAQEAAASSEG